MNSKHEIKVVNTVLQTREEFSKDSGLEEGVVLGLVNKGHLPTVKVGKYRLINVALVRKKCLEREDYDVSPLMS